MSATTQSSNEHDARPASECRKDAPGVSPEGGSLLAARALRAERGDRVLFTGLGFDLAPGRAVHVHGRNGSGKTTLLRAICGFGRFDEGELYWRGARVHPGHRAMLAELHFAGHAAGVKLELTPLENLRVGAALHAGRPVLTPPDALAAVQLEGFEDAPSRALSAGQRRRLALARLLVTRAALWVLDEPFTALDAEGVELVRSLIERHLETGGALLVTSHQAIELRGGPSTRLELDRPPALRGAAPGR